MRAAIQINPAPNNNTTYGAKELAMEAVSRPPSMWSPADHGIHELGVPSCPSAAHPHIGGGEGGAAVGDLVKGRAHPHLVARDCLQVWVGGEAGRVRGKSLYALVVDGGG